MSDQSSDEQTRAPLTETIQAHGHENVSGQHESTFEVTSDDFLTPAGDCILAIEADRTPADFDPEFVAGCQDADATIEITLKVGERETTVRASGHPDLTFESERSAVVRTSDYVDERTVAVQAEKAAGDIDRKFITALESGAPLTLTLAVE